MKFDVVIGNPPYNNDIYIDFSTTASSLASKFICLIIPSKWQAKGGDKNKRFRYEIAPYISHIVSYKDSTDIFNIEEWGGVCYFLADKSNHDNKLIKNVSLKNINLNSNWESHDESNIILLPQKLIAIINKVKSSTSLAESLEFNRQVFVREQDRGDKIDIINNKLGIDYVEVMQGDQVVGYRMINELLTTDRVDKWKCISSIIPGAVYSLDYKGQLLGMFKISIIGPYQVPKGSFPILHYFDSYDECLSFVSYMNTKLNSLLCYLGCCGTTLTKEFFRFIPDQSTFNHIFTNDELYKKYNINDDEQYMIESLIKERR